jgi:hypothetical protein
MEHKSILVVTDAGSAGRFLLARKDVDVRWALTVEEALAVVKLVHPEVCVVREELAAELMTAFKKETRVPPVVVLLEKNGWDRRDLYFGLGATALAVESANERILEAVSELTGISFFDRPRVQFSTVLDVEIDGEPAFIETTELSVSGVTVRGFPVPKIGARAELDFVMAEPPVRTTAMVVRTYEHAGETICGMCFVGLDEERRMAIENLVESVSKAEPLLPDPAGFTGDLGTFTLDLREEVGGGNEANQVYINMLHEAVKNKTAKVPSWVRRVEGALTKVERASIESAQPAWAEASIVLRIDLERARREHTLTQDAAISRAIEHCCVLATEAKGAAREMLIEVATIRAAVLREAYAPRVLEKKAKPAKRTAKTRKQSRGNSLRA